MPAPCFGFALLLQLLPRRPPWPEARAATTDRCRRRRLRRLLRLRAHQHQAGHLRWGNLHCLHRFTNVNYTIVYVFRFKQNLLVSPAERFLTNTARCSLLMCQAPSSRSAATTGTAARSSRRRPSPTATARSTSTYRRRSTAAGSGRSRPARCTSISSSRRE